MSGEQNVTKKDSTFDVVLNWVLCNVFYACIPLICACIFKFLGRASIDLLKLTPDCLLVGYAISISAKACIDGYDESDISKKKRNNFEVFTYITCAICCILYAGLFGEFSAFETIEDTTRLWFVIVGLVFVILVYIGIIWHLESIHNKNKGS